MITVANLKALQLGWVKILIKNVKALLSSTISILLIVSLCHSAIGINPELLKEDDAGFSFFKDPRDEIITLRSGPFQVTSTSGEITFPRKLRGLRFQERNGATIALKGEKNVGIVADVRSLEIVNKYRENPDYHLDNTKKLGFYIGGPALVLGFYIWRRRKTAKQEP